MKSWYLLALGGTLIASTAHATPNPPPHPREGNLRLGDVAPDFTVQDLAGQATVRLSELRGKPVALIFGSCT